MPSLFNHQDLEKFFNKQQVPERKRRSFRRLLFREFMDLEDCSDDSALTSLIKDHFDIPKLKIISRQDSQIDGATKLLLQTDDGQNIETVILRIGTGRTSLCISSQAGCTEKCTFCSTATLGFKRNLTLGEIIAQVMLAGQILREEERQIRNIVFMGMGEPLRNTKNVLEALDLMLSSAYMGLSSKRVTVSTIGITENIGKLREQFPEVNLALSLHASNDKIRNILMPINKTFPMAKIKETLLSVQEQASGKLMIQYLLIKDLNDTPAQAAELAIFLKDINCIINLIPYNDSMGMGNWKCSSEEKMVAFQKVLQEQDFQVTRRHSLGQDIDAACGQLAAKNQ
ncbi:23S rRNA (adenine(2503)-C(2))-methyltransferase RlmN [Lentisphaera profundi]|uniref:23S rRNA (Adenine(2503)-C(2))-methyltransferase RlmN n=1 Tax=Lentisphaera profundi TaxID=1658616 RepID=A0ABY7VVE8_9BACT|nr:23S rRNA (adenine(2503)-C(2))-methyltransferase RlmN [Lentisphaera profundi]WDE96806.1 23S rRNA (adenine(2503)-C(2))-methyltransferase RlmN [Lentisphaera profundi]